MHAECPGRRDGPDDFLAEAAALWLARRDRGFSAREKEQFEQWLNADPRHAAEFARLDADWRTCDLAKESPQLAAMAASLDRATAARATPERGPRAHWVGLFAAAAALAVVAGVVWTRAGRESATSDSTAASYQVLASAAKRIAFEDGSVAMVRGDSEVRAEYSATERRVMLLRGEAHFSVEKNPARPFVVSAGRASVRAVGTAFNVRLDPARVEVIVTEGTVQVADGRDVDPARPSPLVSAGHRAVFEQAAPDNATAGIAVTSTAPAEIEQVLAWQDTRLAFSRTPLADAVEAFNRHATPSGVRLVIGDPSLRARQFGGTFRATNVDAFVRLLELSPDLRVERRGQDIVLLSAH